MPFCTQCGNQVGITDTFCGRCGARQTAAAGTGKSTTASDPFRNVSRRTAGMLCYIPLAGWIAAIVVLASPRFQRDRELRFHAFQGIYLFVVYLLVDWVVAPMFHLMPNSGWRAGVAIGGLLRLGILVAWVWMIVKTSQEQFFSLPIIGELAERSVAEQR
jgi:uncharacterized membrane protein